MKENILEVLMYLFENHMQDNCNIELSQEDLFDELKQAGFCKEEIARAFSWLGGLISHSETTEAGSCSDSSFRPLTLHEQSVIGKDCWGFLLYLERIGILDAACREIVIDRLMNLEPEEINLPQVKWVTLMVLFNNPHAKSALSALQQLILNNATGTLQ
jgi:Smg protein